MFKRAGGLAITLAISVAAMRFGVPALGGSGSAAGERKGQGQKQSLPAPSTPPDSGGCTAYDMAVPPTPGKAYDSNSGAAKKKLDEFFGIDSVTEKDKISAQVTYAIALAPDPVHTHLGLMFDRQIAWLEQAAQDEGYIYNSSWLPWKSDEDPALSLLADRQVVSDLTDEREACPGLVLFRRKPDRLSRSPAGEAYRRGLIVFVVGEQPTGGINQDQWNNALDWLRSYARSAEPAQGAQKEETILDGTLRILGPTFTGSLASLERNLALAFPDNKQNAVKDPVKGLDNASNQDTTRDKHAKKHTNDGSNKQRSLAVMFPEVRVFSGSVSGCSTIQWFEHRVQSLPGLNGHVRFGTFQENDSLHIFRFLEYLKSQDIEPRDTAILSEDETAYAASATGRTIDDTADQGKGSTQDDPCNFPYAEDNQPMHLVYPRDISAVRDAYQKQSVFDSGDEAKRSVHSILKDETTTDAGGGITDTVPAFGANVSAVAQEAYLFGIVSFLRTHHSQYLILRCTNPLDYLFLTRFFHREYPEARIVTVGSDLLFRREIDTTEFRGVLALSSYPLIPRSQHWTKVTLDQWEIDPHNHLIFDAFVSEGIYTASRYLLRCGKQAVSGTCKKDETGIRDISTNGDGSVAPLHVTRAFASPDYAYPFWLQMAENLEVPTHPPTWIAVLGRDGYWPIAVMRDERLKRDKEFEQIRLDFGGKGADAGPGKGAPQPPLSTAVELDRSGAEPTSDKAQHFELKMTPAAPYTHLEKPRQYSDWLRMSYPMSWQVCLLLSGLLAGYQFWGVYKGSAKPYRMFSIFRVTHKVSEDVLFASSCALALMPYVEVEGFGFFPGAFKLIGSLGWQIVAAVVLVALFLLLTCLLFKKHGLRVLTLFLAFLSLMIFFYILAFVYGTNAANELPFVYRMAHLTDGVSPLIPILLLTVGFYLWNWNALAGNLLLSPGCPLLPKFLGKKEWPGDHPNRLGEEQKRISQKVAEKVLKMARPLSFPWRIAGLPVCLFLSAIFCFAMPWHLPLLSLEGTSFNLLLNSLLLLGFLLTAGEGLRLYFTWVSLQRLLQALGRLRLRRTLARLRPIDANSLWSVSGNVPRVQYRLFDRQLGAARRILLLKRSAKSLRYLDDAICYGQGFTGGAESEVERGILWDQPVMPRNPRRKDHPKAIREVMADAVAQVLNEILLPEWATEKTSLNFESDDEKAEDGKAVPCKLPLSDSLYIQAAEEFVSFHYIGFIQNIAARIRTMTLSMLSLFVLVCFAISFYPFVPRTEISVFIILDLALIGSAVAWVYAGMERDEIMSYIANTKPGRLGAEFWLKLSGFLIGPIIGIVTTQFPAIADSVIGWLQPGLDAIK